MSEPIEPIFEDEENADRRSKKLTDQETYNVVSDVGGGVNIRMKDNLFQALCIFVCIVLGIGVGYAVSARPIDGLMLGGVGGLFVGLFGSGIFLMLYRGIRHVKGKHD